MKLSFTCEELVLVIDERGIITDLTVCGKKILKEESPFIRLLQNGEVYDPVSVAENNGEYVFAFANNETVTMGIYSEKTAVRAKVLSVSDAADAVEFGPVKVLPDEVVGEVIGVVQGGDIAFGMMALNIKTVEGLPWNYAEKLEAILMSNGAGANISVGGLPTRDRAAVQLADNGSALMFYGMNRTRSAYGKVTGADHAIIAAMDSEDPDAHIEGSELIFYGGKRDGILARIGELEKAYGLPHPEIDGEWEKTARRAMKSYLISEFSADEVDMVLDKAEIAGMDTIYHIEPFKNWGHFEWREMLADSDADFYEKITKKAKARGMHVGLHTLTNFTTTNDPFVTPIPDAGLLKLAKTELLAPVTDSDTEISLRPESAFGYALTLNGVQIGNEIVTYTSLSEEGGVLKLNGVTRGAFATKASGHSAGDTAYLLRDYPYKTFFPDIYLQDKMADRLAELFNNCQVDQISFDGLEGCEYTGQGIYATSRFFMRCVNGWDHFVLNDGSNLHHFNWHYNTRMNWGEPWGEAMRTGQVESRIRNQSFFARNLFPRMIGWFLLRLADRKFETSNREDLEWALSESAGFDAGFSMSVAPSVMRKHGRIDELLAQIKHWDKLRLANVFTDEQKACLRDPANEFRLEKIDENRYMLYPISISKTYTCALGEMQPGQPGGSDWSVTNPLSASFAFRLRVLGDGEIRNPMFKTAAGTIKFPCTVAENQYLLFDPDGRCEVTDRNYKKLETVQPIGSTEIPAGTNALAFSCDHDRDDTPDVLINFITMGEGEEIRI